MRFNGFARRDRVMTRGGCADKNGEGIFLNEKTPDKNAVLRDAPARARDCVVRGDGEELDKGNTDTKPEINLNKRACERASVSGAFDRGNSPTVYDIRRAAWGSICDECRLWTGKELQLTVNSLSPQQTREDGRGAPLSERMILITEGRADVELSGRCKEHAFAMRQGELLLLPRGAWCVIKNTDRRARLIYFSIYAPPSVAWRTDG